MAIPGVGRLLYFQIGADGVMTPSEFESDPRYGFEPDGVNFYYGIADFNVDALKQTGKALNFDQEKFFERMRQFALGSAASEKLVVLGLEPPHLVDFRGRPESGAADPFGFVADHLDLVTKLADELNAVQQSVRSDSSGTKQLSIVVRYASEMNDRPNSETPLSTNSWGHQPGPFKETFQTVRNIFTAHAPGLLFAFSPAIRADLNPAVNSQHPDPDHFELSNYWPGDDLVDYVSCTWYVDELNNLQPATNYLRSYLQEFQPRVPRLGIDEIGGIAGGSNQAVLEAMVEKLKRLNATVPGMFFNYLAFFLGGRYGIDTDLTGFA